MNGSRIESVCSTGKQTLHLSKSEKKLPLGWETRHCTIYIDSIAQSAQTINAKTEITVVSKQPSLTSIDLSLLGFTIDSIKSGALNLFYSYDDTTISISLATALSIDDSIDVMIYYNGNPKKDLSGWGGFYFSGSYAFNLGVGFDADPHNYGRAWYPCVDEFTSRSSYDFHITTAGNSKAFCNGTLQQQTPNPDGTITWHWKMNETIPSYLVSMAVGEYFTLEQSTTSGVPVQFACLPSDTNNVKATFGNLDTTVTEFINAYGPYPYDKIGYCLIPFNSGAMEHASSIHIGRAFINGSQTYATLWAHELAHMWWGDKVTCETAEDMWLNEGFASFNEAYYTQILYGDIAYRNWIRANHRKVVQFAHTPAQDGSYLTLNNIPHQYTYGYHVYQKGASIAHSLRGFMGDSAFFSGCQNYMDNRAYSHASSADLRDDLTAGSTVDVTRFFDDWVFTPGFPHFSIDSVTIYIGAFDHVYVHTRQRSKGVNHLYEMPVEINLTNGNDDATFTVVIDSVTNVFHFPLLFTPTWVSIDRNLKITDAIVDFEKNIGTTGSHIMYDTNLNLNVQNVGASNSDVRIEHNFVPPDGFKQSNPGIRLSDYHYWKIDGLFDPAFLTKATFVYDGSTSPSTGYLDNSLITSSEDSIVLLYRENTGSDWQLVNNITRNTGPSVTDKRGSIVVDTLKKGEYTLGIYDFTVNVASVGESNISSILVYPNPSSGIVDINLSGSESDDGLLRIVDAGGRLIYEKVISRNETSISWDSGDTNAGVYHILYLRKNMQISFQKLILQ